MVSTQNLTFSYGALRFNFPDLFVTSDEPLLITGGSGKGKTTLMHLLGGLLRPDGGEILIGESQINSLSERKLDHFRGQHIGIVLQQSHFIASLNVLDNVVLASWLANRSVAKDRGKLLLKQLGLGDQMYKHPSKLSVGQQQRVSIARALINSPKLLLADEPTSSLDDANAMVVANLLSELSKEFGAALIIVTHDQRLKDRFTKIVAL